MTKKECTKVIDRAVSRLNKFGWTKRTSVNHKGNIDLCAALHLALVPVKNLPKNPAKLEQIIFTLSQKNAIYDDAFLCSAIVSLGEIGFEDMVEYLVRVNDNARDKRTVIRFLGKVKNELKNL